MEQRAHRDERIELDNAGSWDFRYRNNENAECLEYTRTSPVNDEIRKRRGQCLSTSGSHIGQTAGGF